MGVASDQERLARAVRNPGRLILGPTSTTGSFPYGGESLGLHSDMEAVWRCEYIQSRDPASGRVSEISRRGVEYPELYCLLEGSQWDETVVAGIFSRVSAAASLAFPQPTEARAEGTNIPAVMQAWPPVLFAAIDPAHDSIYLRRPIPRLSLQQSVMLSTTMGAGLPIMLTPTVDASQVKDWQIARLENITL